MKYDKLVRDKVPEIIKSNGQEPVTPAASNDEEYWSKLKDKLKEEVDEFLENNSKEELIDVLEVIDSIKDFKEISERDLESLKEKKFEQRGEFKERIILDKVKDEDSFRIYSK